MNWYCLYTKPRQEDVVAYHLKTAGIEALNVKLKKKRFNKAKAIEQIGPLFPCYLFAKFDAGTFSHLITYTRGVRYIVGKDRPIAVEDEIISAIKTNIDADSSIEIKPRRFEKGDRVFMTEGPLKDFYGIFEKEIKGTERAMILLEALSCKVLIDSHFLVTVCKQAC